MTRCTQPVSIPALLANPRSPRALVAFLQKLIADRAERDRYRLFYCDGLRFVHRAAEQPYCRPILFVHAPDSTRRHPGIPALLARIRARHPTVPLFPVPAESLNALSQAPEPQGVGAIVEQSWTPLYRLAPDPGLCYLALDTVLNAGNFGTILRTLEAVGGSGVICLPPAVPDAETVDPFAPSVIRAGMGSTFALRFTRTGGNEWRNWRRKHGIRLIGTSPHTGDDFRTVRYGERVVLWMGSERTGLTDEQMGECDTLVRIPMAPTASADSLNLATATSILLYELYDQRWPARGA